MLCTHSLLAGILIIPSHARAGNGGSPVRSGAPLCGGASTTPGCCDYAQHAGSPLCALGGLAMAGRPYGRVRCECTKGVRQGRMARAPTDQRAQGMGSGSYRNNKKINNLMEDR